MLVPLGASTKHCLSPTLGGNTPASTVAASLLRSGSVSGYPPVCSLEVAVLGQHRPLADTVATTARQCYDAPPNIEQYSQSAFPVHVVELLVDAGNFGLLDLEIEHLVFSYINASNYPSHFAHSHIAGLITYHLQATLVVNSAVIEAERQVAGRFILATNVLEAEQLSAQQALQEYKDQQSASARLSLPQRPFVFYLQCVPQVSQAHHGVSNGDGVMFIGLYFGST